MSDQNKNNTEDVYTGYNAEDFADEEFEVDEDYLDEAEYMDDVTPEYDVYGKRIDDEENPNKREINYFEKQLYDEFSPEEIRRQREINRKYLNRNRNNPIEKDIRTQNMRRALECGVYDYINDVNNFDDHLAFMDAVQDMLMQDPVFILEQLREKKAKLAAQERASQLKQIEGRVNIRDLCQALDETYMITKQSINYDVRREVVDSMSSLMDICRNVFSQPVIYTDNELASLIGILNKVCEDREFLAMAFAKDVYFRFSVDYANNLLQSHKDVPPEVISALNILINVNAKLLNVIILEKSETYAPIIGLVKQMKKKKKL